MLTQTHLIPTLSCPSLKEPLNPKYHTNTTTHRPRDETYTREDIVHLGYVKWFDDIRGYGFITDQVSLEDHFVHVKDIISDADYVTLRVNDIVEYVPQMTVKGMQALKVRALDD